MGEAKKRSKQLEDAPPPLMAEDLPSGGEASLFPLLSPCHRTAVCRALWEPHRRAARLFCVECGQHVVSVKVERRTRIVMPQ